MVLYAVVLSYVMLCIVRCCVMLCNNHVIVRIDIYILCHRVVSRKLYV